MIKLVASDMDGTLLNSKKELTKRTRDAIAALVSRGIHFVAASGRQHFNLFEVFERANLRDGVSFLAENGAILFDGREEIFVDRIEPELVREVVTAARAIEGVYPVLDGVKSAYFEDDNEELLYQANHYFAKRQRLPDVLSCLEFDEICKIALLDVSGAEKGVYRAMQPFSDRAQVLLSGPEWVDLINYGVSKGEALTLLCRRYGIERNEVMAFGDYLNDIEMLKACAYSFAMKNAHPRLVEAARYRAASNDEDGVAQVLENWLETGKIEEKSRSEL